jgi:hypothetical protein
VPTALLAVAAGSAAAVVVVGVAAVVLVEVAPLARREDLRRLPCRSEAPRQSSTCMARPGPCSRRYAKHGG